MSTLTATSVEQLAKGIFAAMLASLENPETDPQGEARFYAQHLVESGVVTVAQQQRETYETVWLRQHADCTRFGCIVDVPDFCYILHPELREAP